jgi:hypothetical protein
MSEDNAKLFEYLAEDIVQLHNAEGINLTYWPSAQEFVTKYYKGEMPIKRSRLSDWKA